jgi:DNA repair photolyase
MDATSVDGIRPKGSACAGDDPAPAGPAPAQAAFRWSGLERRRSGVLVEVPEPWRGAGAYRRMVFHEVLARSVLNRVPERSPAPFRWTVNAYRGCSHACTYCFARPTHGYLGFDAGAGFDREIVVKVNAAPVLRRQLAPGRWRGQAIAMGTNTDPYQAAEGRYRITRAILEVLVERANPFGLLTKSTLVLRDLDVLVEASRQTAARVDLSIGCLDDDVWRLTEPGTPPPRQRVQAVAKLRAAGVDSGVLVAPVQPGLSDHPDQIEAVVDAVLAAGAARVSVGGLRLSGEVRRHHLAALGAQRPELARRYRRAVPTSAVTPRFLEHLERKVTAAGAVWGNRWAARPGGEHGEAEVWSPGTAVTLRRPVDTAQLALEFG